MKNPASRIYRTTNWCSYNQALINRGNISIWFNPKTQWYAQSQGSQGRNLTYSDTATQFCLMIKSLFKLCLLMVNGLFQSLIILRNIILNGWENSVVIFKQAQTNLDTLVHEIGHSLKLPHIFEYWGNDYQFYQGQTSNIMDYTWYETVNWDNKLKKWMTGANFKKRKFFSKVQWDLLRSDRSLK